jgi:hypothetical protein
MTAPNAKKSASAAHMKKRELERVKAMTPRQRMLEALALGARVRLVRKAAVES